MNNCTQEITSTDIIFDTIGILGGVIFTIMNIPQIVQIVKTKSSKDLSYITITFYIVGTFMIITYGVYFDLFAVYIPCCLELVIEFILLGLKCFYDKLSLKQKCNVEDTKDIEMDEIKN